MAKAKTTKEQALYDLGYEWRMYRDVHYPLQGLPRRESTDARAIGDIVRDALVEAVIVHARN
jgi:hypothetical protein